MEMNRIMREERQSERVKRRRGHRGDWLDSPVLRVFVCVLSVIHLWNFTNPENAVKLHLYEWTDAEKFKRAAWEAKNTLAVRPLAYFNAVCFNEGHLLCDALISTLASVGPNRAVMLRTYRKWLFSVAPLLLLLFFFFFLQRTAFIMAVKTTI